MEQIIKINVPEGKKLDKTINENGDIITFTIVDEEPVHSKSWGDFCKNNPDVVGEYVIENGQIRQIDEFPFYRNVFRNEGRGLLATKEDAEGIIALIQLTRLHDEWVGNYAPDWTDSSYKYCIYSYGGKIGIYCTTKQYHILSFPTEELANEFFNCFEGLINKAKKFI